VKLAIFGGTFDPIHNAHLAVARAARTAFQLDRVLLVPAARPPHKKKGPRASYEDRYRMVELACAGEPGLEPSRLEAGEESSYSIHTIEKLRATLGPGDRIYFLIGADAFAEIETWRRWREAGQMVEFIVVSRPGYRYARPEGFRVHRLEEVELPVSSSEIRARLARGEEPEQLPAAVLRYIQERGLYKPEVSISGSDRDLG
jgi:nicotinate-nucleotide adenylyltransferase